MNAEDRVEVNFNYLGTFSIKNKPFEQHVVNLFYVFKFLLDIHMFKFQKTSLTIAFFSKNNETK